MGRDNKINWLSLTCFNCTVLYSTLSTCRTYKITRDFCPVRQAPANLTIYLLVDDQSKIHVESVEIVLISKLGNIRDASFSEF